jgi:hypothetical protein
MPTECIYGFLLIFRIHSSCFSKLHWLTCICGGNVVCFLHVETRVIFRQMCTISHNPNQWICLDAWKHWFFNWVTRSSYLFSHNHYISLHALPQVIVTPHNTICCLHFHSFINPNFDHQVRQFYVQLYIMYRCYLASN